MIQMCSPNAYLWLVTSQPTTVQSVRASLEGDDQTAPVRLCGDLWDLADQLDGSDDSVIIMVDIDPDPTQQLHQLESLVGRYEQNRFVILSERLDADLMRKAMEVGARQYVLKSSIAQDLPQIVQKLKPTNNNGRRTKPGSILTVLSAAGGCGATTLAVNLASELHLMQRQPALLVDLDSSYGGISRYLGLSGEYSLADVLEYRDRIDPQLISSTALPYNDDLHALINPVSVDFSHPRPIAYEQFDLMLEHCGQSYGWTVIDAARLPIDIAASLVERSDHTLIVSQLRVKDLRIARQLWLAMIDRGLPGENIHHVINRFRKRDSPITLEDARQALDIKSELHLIENDYKAARESMDIGQTLAETSPRSTLRRSIQSLAQMLTQPNTEGAKHAQHSHA